MPAHPHPVHLPDVSKLSIKQATTTWESQQKMNAIRKVYHRAIRAIQIPLDNVEPLGTNLNRITAKKFMADLSPAHMQARTVPSTTLVTYPLNSPEIFLPSLPKFEACFGLQMESSSQMGKGNPLEIEEKDWSTLITRIQGVYRKAVIRLEYYSEIWHVVFLLFYNRFLLILSFRLWFMAYQCWKVY